MSPKEKFPLYLSPEKKATLERRHTEDGSRSITGFIENAIDFYLDYLSANNSGLFLPSAVQSYLDGRLNQMENRMASLLFKQVLFLKYSHGYSIDEIALILSMSKENVKKTIQRARKKLEQSLESEKV